MARKNKARRTGGRLVLFVVGQFIKWLFIVIATVILFGAMTGVFMLGHAKTYIEDIIIPQAQDEQTSLESIAFDASQSSTMYYTDANGNLVEMKTLHAGENRIWIPYEEMPENLINATVAIEDKRFWEHDGVDWKRTAAAVVYMFTGRDVQGGSTITQQLIKNVTQNNETTVRRKVLEIFTALEYDANHDKEEILENYLNYIYLGRQCNGVYTAAHKYFDKEVSELTLVESACLISITNNPSLYDPFNHPENNFKRAHTVIKQMFIQGYITDEEAYYGYMAEVGYHPTGELDENGYMTFAYEDGTATLQFNLGAIEESTSTGTIDSYYVDAVINQVQEDLMTTYGLTKEAASNIIFTGGLEIFTCYDAELQAKVDAVYLNKENFDGYESDTSQPLLSAVTIIDNATGRVVALGDNREKTANRVQVNAVDALRQPGSSIKPLAVYAPALEEGLITPYSAVDDTPFMLLDGTNPWPKNSGRKYSGLTDIYTSVIKSHNTSAVKTLDLLTLDTSYYYLENVFGITSLVPYMEGSNGKVITDIAYGSLALGGFTKGVSTYEMAGAYSIFANNGIYIKPHLYTEVKDSDGNVILSYDETGTAVLSEDTVHYINTMLTGVVTSGTGTSANVSGHSVAGKTGTTSNKYDLWFCGYSGYYTAAVWSGYEMNEEINYSGNVSARLWKQVMSALLEGKENMPLPSTNKNVISVSYCTKSGGLATPACTLAECAATGRYIEGDEPTEYCTLHELIKVCIDCPIDEVVEGVEYTGQYRIAGEFCPEESQLEVAVLNYVRDEIAGSVEAEDSKLMKTWLEEQETCTFHNEEWLMNVELWSVQHIVAPVTSYEKKEGDPAFYLNARSEDGAGNPGGAVTFVSSNPSIVTVDENGVVTILRAGYAQILITADATEYADPVTLAVSVVVAPASQPPEEGGEGGEGGGIGDIIEGILNPGRHN